MVPRPGAGLGGREGDDHLAYSSGVGALDQGGGGQWGGGGLHGSDRLKDEEMAQQLEALNCQPIHLESKQVNRLLSYVLLTRCPGATLPRCSTHRAPD